MKRRFSRFVSAIVLTAMVMSFGGCGNKADGKTDFQAYHEPVRTEDVVVEGDVYYVDSQILLTSVENATYRDVKRRIKKDDGEIIGYISDTGDYQVHINGSKTFEKLEELVAAWKNDPLFEDASLAYVAPISSDAVDYMNDPWEDSNVEAQENESILVWNEDKPEGTNWWAEAIGMPSVWRMDLSTQTVKVGIIDSMFDTTNEDLDEGLFVKTWYNPENEDGSCKVSELYNDALAELERAKEAGDADAAKAASGKVGITSHGTHVAGIIAAQAGNDFGIAGINQNVELYGYSKFSEESAESEEGQWESIFGYKCAIAHLLNEGVRVINISLGNTALVGTQNGDPYSMTFTEQSSKALESFLLKYIEVGKEFLIVKTAGNDSNQKEIYDAKYDFFGAIRNEKVAKRIVMVGAAERDILIGCYQVASFSNRGERVDVYAPGVDILSDIPSDAATLMDGTSMAAPMVTGLASLIWGINSKLSAEQVRSIICDSSAWPSWGDQNGNFLFGSNLDVGSVPIVNANICVQLAKGTVGTDDTPEKEYGTISGVVYAVTADGSDYVEAKIEALNLYSKSGEFVSTLTLQNLVYPPKAGEQNDETSVLLIPTYSTVLEPGTYKLEAVVEGFETQIKELSVKAGDVVQVNFEFEDQNSLHFNQNGLAFLTEKPSGKRPEQFTYEEYTFEENVTWSESDGWGHGGVYLPQGLRDYYDAEKEVNLVSFYGDFFHNGMNIWLRTNGLRIYYGVPLITSRLSDNEYLYLDCDQERYCYIIDGETNAYFVCESVMYENEHTSDDTYYYKTALDAGREIEETITITNLSDGSQHIFGVRYNEKRKSIGYSEVTVGGYDVRGPMSGLEDGENVLYCDGYDYEGKYSDVSQVVEYIQTELAKYGLADRVFSEESMLKNHTPVLAHSIRGIPKTINKTDMEDAKIQGEYLIGLPVYSGTWYPDGPRENAVSVSDAYSDTEEDYCYHIPQINLNGGRGAAINQTIYDECYDLLDKQVYQSIKKYGYPELGEMVYTWGQKDDVVSVVVQSYYTTYSWTDFYVYTLSAETGKRVGTDTVYKAYGLTEDGFYDLVRETMQRYWDDCEDDMLPRVGEKMFRTLVDQTLADSNVKAAIPYVNKDGDLCIVADIYSPAGAECYPHMLNTSGDPDEGYIVCVNHVS